MSRARIFVEAAIVSTLLLGTSQPAAAITENGAQFYNQCGTGAEAGFLNRGFCHDYLMGFADALAASRQICRSPGTTDTQIVMVVQDWLRAHVTNLNRVPAHIMIRNAIVSAWPCGSH